MNHAQITKNLYGEYRNYNSPHLPSDFQHVDRKHQDFNLSQQKETDRNFIENFLQSRPIRKKDIIKEKKDLEKHANLNISDECFDSNFEELKNRLHKINELIKNFTGNLEAVNKKMIKRRRKREAFKRKKLRYKIMKDETKKLIETKHRIIDDLLNERLEEVNSIKREEALKRQADSVLLEVRRKRNEGKKILAMLSALKKLRELRSKQEEERGGYCSKQLLETFNTVINRFQKLWEKQIEVYNLEEKGLKIMLEENTIPHVQSSKLEINLLHWEKILFGEDRTPDLDIQNLIQVRKDWDKFVTKEPTAMASSIPLGWVVPPATENEEWKMFATK